MSERNRETHKPLVDLKLHEKYLHFRRTKIIATIGPSSDSEEMLQKLIEMGTDLFRINFSHGKAEDHLKIIRLIRNISATLKKDVGIIADLSGPKIRTGTFEKGSIQITEGQEIILENSENPGNDKKITSAFPNLIKYIKTNDRILLDDGKLELEVLDKTKEQARVKVLRGGILENNKGINLPNTKLDICTLSEKDKKDIACCLPVAVDFFALSFVRHPNDIREIKNILKENHADIPVIAKIEKPEALRNIYSIIEVADGIMIARGDLGVELPPEKVPVIQNKLIQLANQNNKPVIVATQMLEKMITDSRPTRAEVTDVSSACLAGTDAVMLSGETAIGRFPLESVSMMNKILRETETYQFFSEEGKFKKYSDKNKSELQNAIGNATAHLSQDLSVRCIFITSKKGYTARIMSSDRPSAPIIALSKNRRTLQRLNLYWGVVPMFFDQELDFREYARYGEKVVKELKIGKSGQYIIMLSSSGSRNVETNKIIIHKMT